MLLNKEIELDKIKSKKGIKMKSLCVNITQLFFSPVLHWKTIVLMVIQNKNIDNSEAVTSHQ